MSESKQPSGELDSTQIDAIVDAVSHAELSEYDAWSDLDALSNRTSIDQIEVDPEGIISKGDRKFKGIFNVYVALHYGGNREELVTSEAFEGTFEGYFQDNKAIIKSMKVDTSPFYE